MRWLRALGVAAPSSAAKATRPARGHPRPHGVLEGEGGPAGDGHATDVQQQLAPLPQTSCETAERQPRAMLPAAGTVVTEMKTPERPPTFAEVSESTPAAAAMIATTSDHLSGV